MPMEDNILVLCRSNMHRSPSVAESIRNPPYGDSYEARGAGLHAGKGQRVPKSLQRAFQTVSQGSLKSRKPRPAGISGILWADKIAIMEPENKNARKKRVKRVKHAYVQCMHAGGGMPRAGADA